MSKTHFAEIRFGLIYPVALFLISAFMPFLTQNSILDTLLYVFFYVYSLGLFSSQNVETRENIAVVSGAVFVLCAFALVMYFADFGTNIPALHCIAYRLSINAVPSFLMMIFLPTRIYKQ